MRTPARRSTAAPMIHPDLLEKFLLSLGDLFYLEVVTANLNPEFDPASPVPLPIDGVLDLHGFRPQEISDLVPEYLEACRRKGIVTVRIIHGKGIGNLRRTVHAILSRHSQVISFVTAGEQMGGWGATMVELRV